MDYRCVTVFVKNNSVLVVSAVLALLSFTFTNDQMGSFDSIDVRTLCILFCFMATVSMMSGCGAFERTASVLISRSGTVRMLCIILVMLPLVCSMFITNDVALITFVPLTIGILSDIDRDDLMIPVVVLQTAGANLGSMITPFGNPQNLYIFSRYGLELSDFISELLPLVLIGTVVIVSITLISGRGGRLERIDPDVMLEKRHTLAVACILFAVCIATVLRFVPFWATLVLVTACTLTLMPGSLRKVDYGLLLTFMFLFVFTGNLSSYPPVSDALGNMMSWDPEITSVVASQFISNVPAAVLLSGFTDDWAGLLSGVDIGGFGTPIASMASLISLKMYLGTEKADMKGYMVVFTAVNVLMLVVLLTVSALLRP